MKISIENRFNQTVIFEYECENNTLLITLEQAAKQGVKLFYPDLSNLDLSGANLENLYLHADLGKTNLSGANLKGATLYCNLCDANLSGADLTKAYITAEFIHANLQGANFERATLVVCDFTYADVNCANFENAYFINTSIDSAINAHTANVTGAAFLRPEPDTNIVN